MPFDESRIVPNPRVGGSGGDSFSVPQSDSGQTITKLEVWAGYSSGAGVYVLRGIRLTWSDETPQETRGMQKGDLSTLVFEPGERITRFSLSGAWRVDKIDIQTDKGQHFAVGGNGGTQTLMDVGSGFLQGFDGAATEDVDSLRPRILKFKEHSESMIVSNTAVGGTGGQPFWACRADAEQRVWKLEVWHGLDVDNDEWHVLRAIQIIWEDGTATRLYGMNNKNAHSEYFTFDLKRDEGVKEMTLWGHGRTDRIKFKTTLGRTFDAGGSGGDSRTVHLGSGVLVGFEGRAEGDVDSLAPIFLSKK